jgi:hypothetical protein
MRPISRKRTQGGLFWKSQPTSITVHSTNNARLHFGDPTKQKDIFEQAQFAKESRIEYNRQASLPKEDNPGPLGMYPEMKGIHLYARPVMDLEGKYSELEREISELQEKMKNSMPDPKDESIMIELKTRRNNNLTKLKIAKKTAYDAFKEKSFTFTSPKENRFDVYDRIVVFPCLQELRAYIGIGTMTGYEKEQQPAHWDPVVHRLSSAVNEGYFYTNASDEYYRYWGGEPIPDEKRALITKYDALEIPDCRSFGFPTTCRKKDCASKWKMFASYFKQKQQEQKQQQEELQVMMMFSHHNRMVSSDRYQGLIPLAEGAEHMKFANLFTVSFEITKKSGELASVLPNVVVKGFPDKGIFAKFDQSKRVQGQRAIVGGAPKIYVDDVMYLNVEPIKKGIRDAFEINEEFSGTITLGRHGNANHNKPVNAQTTSERTNSSLSFLGMLQARIAGIQLKGMLEGKKVMLTTSFLGRTQLTGSLVLQYAGAKMSEKMLEFTEYLKHEAYFRFLDIGYSMGNFKLKNCSPFGDRNYEEHNPDKLFEEIEREASRYYYTVFPTKGGQSRKSRKIKSKKKRTRRR